MKKRFLLCILAAIMMFPGVVRAESELRAVHKDGSLNIVWQAEGECVLTVYRNGWPIGVWSVNGSDGGRTVYVGSQPGKYSVRLRTATDCETVVAVSGDPAETPVDTPAPTVEPTVNATVIPSVEPTVNATVIPSVNPTANVTVRPTFLPTPEPTAMITAAPVVLPEGQTMSAMASEVVRQVNEERAKYGLAPLTVDSQLTSAACIRAQEIVSKFSHTRPDGTKWSTVSSLAFGENIAKGHSTADRVMAAWLTSEGHRANILRSGFGSIGVCALKVNGIVYWVQLFGK